MEHNSKHHSSISPQVARPYRATPRTGDAAMKRTHSIVLASVAAVSLATVSVACGSYSSGGSGGSSGAGSGGSSTGSSSTGSGGSAGTGGSSSTGSGGSDTGSGGSSSGSGGSSGCSSTAGVLPGDILSQCSNKIASAHSTVRVIVSGYTGPLYQVCKGTAVAGPSSCTGTPQDIGST